LNSEAVICFLSNVILGVHISPSFTLSVAVSSAKNPIGTTQAVHTQNAASSNGTATLPIFATFTLSVTVVQPPVTEVITLYAAVSLVPVVAFTQNIIHVLWSKHRSPLANPLVIAVARSLSVLYSALSMLYTLSGFLDAVGNTVPVVHAKDVSSSFPIYAHIESKIPV